MCSNLLGGQDHWSEDPDYVLGILNVAWFAHGTDDSRDRRHPIARSPLSLVLEAMKEDTKQKISSEEKSEETAVENFGDLETSKKTEISTLLEQLERKMKRTGELKVEIVDLQRSLAGKGDALAEVGSGSALMVSYGHQLDGLHHFNHLYMVNMVAVIIMYLYRFHIISLHFFLSLLVWLTVNTSSCHGVSLPQDRKMLEELKKSCASKATAWDARTAQRNKELVALQELEKSEKSENESFAEVLDPLGLFLTVVFMRLGAVLKETIKMLDSDKSLDLFRGRGSFIQTSADEDARREHARKLLLQVWMVLRKSFESEGERGAAKGGAQLPGLGIGREAGGFQEDLGEDRQQLGWKGVI